MGVKSGFYSKWQLSKSHLIIIIMDSKYVVKRKKGVLIILEALFENSVTVICRIVL